MTTDKSHRAKPKSQSRRPKPTNGSGQSTHSMTQTDRVTTYYPPHPPRVATNVYIKSHHQPTVVENMPCWA